MGVLGGARRSGSTDFVPPSGGIKDAVEQGFGPETLHFGVPRSPKAVQEPSQRIPLGAGVGFWSILSGLGVLWRHYGYYVGIWDVKIAARIGYLCASSFRKKKVLGHRGRMCLKPSK